MLFEQVWEVNFILWCQQLGDWLRPIMTLVTQLGYAPFYAYFLTFLYWCVDRRLALRVAIFALVSSSLNSILKLVFHAPRPYWVDARIQALYHPSTEFGMPSGHAQTSSNCWLVLAASLRKRWMWILAVVLFGMIGISRLYLGAHFLSQVLSGWCLGGILVVAILTFEEPVLRRIRGLSIFPQLLIAGGIALIFLLIGEITMSRLADFALPAAWSHNMARYLEGKSFEPVRILEIAVFSGALLGFLWGGILLRRGRSFRADGIWWKRIIRYLTGMVILAGLGGILTLLGQIIPFPKEPEWLTHVGLFLAAGAGGLFVAYIIPLLLVRLQLAEPEYSDKL
jgi:membrane-associated phospholipid phosphatase